MRVEVRRQVALGGRVVDAATGVPLAGAEVDAGPAGRAVTDAAGRFAFLDLPKGTYPVEAAYPAGGRRYGGAKAKAQVAYARNGDAKLAWVELRLPPTAVAGTVTGPDAKPVPLAAVRLVGSSERTHTDTAGRYLLSAVEPGPRTLHVEAHGVQQDAPAAIAEPGATTTVDIALGDTKQTEQSERR